MGINLKTLFVSFLRNKVISLLVLYNQPECLSEPLMCGKIIHIKYQKCFIQLYLGTFSKYYKIS